MNTDRPDSSPGLPRRTLLAALALASGLPARGQASAPLSLCLAPYLSPAALFAAFRPLREHLQRTLAQPVELTSARDFTALAAAVQARQHDIALLPAHMARLAVADWGWSPMARTVPRAEVQVLVRDDGPVQEPADLRGRNLGMLDLQSLTAAVGVQWLNAQPGGLAAAVNVTVLPSINSAMYALASDEVAAVVASASQLVGLPAQTPQRHRMLARLSDIPGPWYVAQPGVPEATLARWREALLSFAPDASRPTTAANSRLMALSVVDTATVDAHAEYLRRQLAAKR